MNINTNINTNINIASFDIGKKNFCFYIQELSDTEIKELSGINNIPRDARYLPDGTPSVEMSNILDEIYMKGKTILHENIDLTENCDSKKYLDTETFHNLTNVLDKYEEYFDRCKYFVIEQQMSFRGRYNTMALKIGQHVASYFYFKYGRFKRVIEFPSFHKTCVLGSKKLLKGKYKNGKLRYKNIDKPARKKWAIVKAQEIMKLRGEEDSILLHPKRGLKLDDFADTFLQLWAFVYLHYIDGHDF